mmetsp:Transcript_17994/g.34321  ORF Transcript_17994/g.34321 Transcript_17994/m.34321 type:complete len:87 (+) Transcript_17994:1877-2137(+)
MCDGCGTKKVLSKKIPSQNDSSSYQQTNTSSFPRRSFMTHAIHTCRMPLFVFEHGDDANRTRKAGFYKDLSIFLVFCFIMTLGWMM